MGTLDIETFKKVCYTITNLTKGVMHMPTEKETTIVQKATIYDLVKILKRGKKKGKETYTVEELEALMDAYIEGAEQ